MPTLDYLGPYQGTPSQNPLLSLSAAPSKSTNLVEGFASSQIQVVYVGMPVMALRTRANNIDVAGSVDQMGRCMTSSSGRGTLACS